MPVHSSVRELLQIMPADHGADEQLDWAMVEESLGVRLPSDYKSFMAVYGAGSIGDDGLGVLAPLPVDYPQWDPESIQDYTPTMRDIWEFEGGVPGVSLGSEAVLAWGVGANANDLGWLMSDPDPDNWPVIAARRHGTPYWAMFDCGMVDFIRRLMLGEFDECPLSDASLWRRPSPFVHWREEQRRWLAGLNPATGEPDPIIQDFLKWPKP
jgi:hypothetical protein